MQKAASAATIGMEASSLPAAEASQITGSNHHPAAGKATILKFTSPDSSTLSGPGSGSGFPLSLSYHNEGEALTSMRFVTPTQKGN